MDAKKYNVDDAFQKQLMHNRPGNKNQYLRQKSVRPNLKIIIWES